MQPPPARRAALPSSAPRAAFPSLAHAALPSAARAALPSPSRRQALRRAVLAWFAEHGRELEFRVNGHPDPWGVLVSEVMAQQTQIGRVEERWPAFMAAFPTPTVMAAASPADVIRAWRGLGYNRRALGLHRAAVAITAAGGAVPSDVHGLMALPGVGPYTARAVAAIAFGLPVGAVDVNVRRVVGRILGVDPSVPSPTALQAAADALVDPGEPGTWTHALMDIGATICRPARPSCPSCPARPWCRTAPTTTARLATARAMTARLATARAMTARLATARTTTAVPAAPSPAAPSLPLAPRTASIPFEQTSRWLRGRIVDRLRDAAPGTVLAIGGPLGLHSAEAVTLALAGLARDGIVELDAGGRARLAGSSEPA